MPYEIVNTVPLPPMRSKFPFEQMQPGDSFFVPDKVAGTMYSNCKRAAKVIGGKFVARAVEGGCRVWRVE